MAEDIKRPEDMTDEELNAFLGEKPQEDIEEKPEKPEESETTEKKEEETEEQEKEEEKHEEEAKPEDKEEKPVEEEKPISKRQQYRIDQLIEKLKQNGVDPEEQVPSKKEPTKPEGLKYEEELDADEETIKSLNDDREKYGQSMYEQGLKEAEALKQWQNAFEFKQMLIAEEPRVLAKYSFMDKDSEDYDEAAARAMVSKYFNFTGFDANTKTAANPVSYLEYVDSEMELAQALAERMSRETRENVTKQAAQTGIRPNGSAPTRKLDLTKAPGDMSDEELDAFLAQVIPKK